MIKFFVDSLQIKKIYELRQKKLSVAILYFCLLVLIISFPLNLQIIRSSGWDLYNFTAGMRETYPDWLPDELPEDIEISANGMSYIDTENSVFLTTNLDNQDLYIVFSPLVDYIPSDRTLVFEPDQISYYGENGEYMFSTDYSNTQGIISFYNLKLDTQSEAVNQFAGMIEDAFGGFAQFKSIIYNTGINIVLNVIMVTVVSFLFLFIRIRYQKVTNYVENIKIVIAAMTIPALIGMFFGLIGVMELSAFSVVIFQFATPIIAYFAIYKGSNIKEFDHKNV